MFWKWDIFFVKVYLFINHYFIFILSADFFYIVNILYKIFHNIFLYFLSLKK